MRRALFILSGLLLYAPVAFGRSDFLLIENPRVLQFLDKYEQPLGASAKAALVPWSPLLIVKEKQTLGDQITMATRFELHGMELLLPRSDDGTYHGAKSAGSMKTLRQCRAINDTVVAGSPVTLTSPSGKAVNVSAGQRCIRVFESGDRVYVLLDGPQKAYGWIEKAKSAALKKQVEEKTKSQTTLTDNIRSRISARIDTVNAVYRNYFEYLNSSTGKRMAIPQWQCKQSSGDAMECTVAGLSADKVPQSTAELLEEISAALLTTGFAARLHDGRILIEPRGVKQ